jgi:protein-tyrosine phosphatase
MSLAPAASLPLPRHAEGPYRICLVCLGNICRSPMAEVVLRAELDRIGLSEAAEVDSAGTGDWHEGEPMDRRARAELAARGLDGSAHRARQIEPSWLAERDLILAMDRSNLSDLRHLAAPDEAERVRLFGDIAGLDGAEIPDPYGGGPAQFTRVLDLLQAGAAHLAAQLAPLLADR